MVTVEDRINRELMTAWAEALEELDEKDWERLGFNMKFWALATEPKTNDLGCCCAYGVGTTLPSWQDAGLNLICRLNPLDPLPSWLPPPDAAAILGLSEAQWNWLTDYRLYPTAPVRPGDVAQRIRSLLTVEVEKCAANYFPVL